MEAVTRRAFLCVAPFIGLAACSSSGAGEVDRFDSGAEDANKLDAPDGEVLTFEALSDEALQQFAQDSILAGAESAWASEDYQIDNIQAIYVSKEYLDELEFNQQENIYFGYSLSEIERQFQGTKHVFTIEEGKTVVHAFEEPDDTFNQVVRNVAIGAGVILVCTTVSVAAGAVAATMAGNAPVVAGALKISHILAISAKSASALAAGLAAIGGICAGVKTGLITDNFDEAIKAAAREASEDFKWGAIVGAVTGGLAAKFKLSRSVRTWAASEDYALRLYGGNAQCAFLNGEEVAWSTAGSTRPDIVRQVGEHLEAIEVKNYNLANSASLAELRQTLTQEIKARVLHLPAGSTQRVVLDVGGRNFSDDLISSVVNELTELLRPVDPSVVVEVMR